MRGVLRVLLDGEDVTDSVHDVSDDGMLEIYDDDGEVHTVNGAGRAYVEDRRDGSIVADWR